MIAYFDTSAVEARAALAHAARIGRLTSRQLQAAKRDLEALIDQLDVVDIDEELVRSAAELAEAHALRAYDAVHLSAEAMGLTVATIG